MKPMICAFSDEIRFTFKEDVTLYLQTAELLCYAPQEILIEKCRAAMTRGRYKVRDTLDLVMLKRHCRLDIFDSEDEIKKKVRFTVDRFDRYLSNFNTDSLPMDVATLENEIILLIIPRPPNLIEEMIEVNGHLNELKEEISRGLEGPT